MLGHIMLGRLRVAPVGFSVETATYELEAAKTVRRQATRRPPLNDPDGREPSMTGADATVVIIQYNSTECNPERELGLHCRSAGGCRVRMASRCSKEGCGTVLGKDANDPVTEFSDALHAAGLRPPGPLITDGQWSYVLVGGNRRELR